MCAVPGSSGDPHVPVLIGPLVEHCAPISGHWLDGTFGAGGYSRALLEAGAERITAIDRDPLAIELAKSWVPTPESRINLIQAPFSEMAAHASDLDGVVLDLGVSSMQLDRAERGFSFMKDGPLDMRMSQTGASAADLVNSLDEAALAEILFIYGEERASRRIARRIVRAREEADIKTTFQLVAIIEEALPRPKPGQSHPATRSFQALRIAVNDEYRQLFEGLNAAETVLKPGGVLAVVTFHSIEDRMVKRFFSARAGHSGNTNRYAPQQDAVVARFEPMTRRAIAPDEQERAANPRARSARLRMGRRTSAPAGRVQPSVLSMPQTAGAQR